MKKSEKWKEIFKSKSLIALVIVFAVAPLLINIGLVITDIIYEKTGVTLTAQGLNNVEWLDFWKQYFAIAISFIGVCVAYISSDKDRKKHLYESNARQYLEEVRREENILVEVTQGFNTGVVYKALLQQGNNNIYEGRMVLTDSRTNMDHTHIKFELLTELGDDFKKCEKCDSSPCVDKEVMIELRNLFYDMKIHYFNMLDIGENFLDRLNQEQKRINLLVINNKMQNNTEQIIDLYKEQGLYEEINASKTELQSIKEQIQALEKSKLESEEINEYVAKIQKEINYINKETRPKFIKYSKIYINMKKAHARELNATGQIQHNKVNETQDQSFNEKKF